MKALEKAAQDRLDTNAGSAAAAAVAAGAGTHQAAPSAATKSELTLEPIAAQVAAPAAAAAPLPAQAARVRAPAPPAIAAPTAAPREPAEAATVVRAGQVAAGGSTVAYLRDRPLVAFGILTTLFLIGYGIYLYIELNPGLFVRQAPRPAPGAPIAQGRAPAPAPAAGAVNPVAATAPPVPLVSLLPPLQESAGTEKPAAPAPTVRPAPIKSADTAATQSPAPPAPAPAPPAPRDTIKVTAGSATPTVDPLLAEAYGALTTGDPELSQRLYNQLLRNDPRNVEALLGLAAIAAQQGDRNAATRHYVKILELDPRNGLAQAGLIGIVGRADPLSAETRVKQLIAREPSAAYLHFTLGNTYVDQNRWPDAQQAYFQAHHLQPDNPDYAYNLAVALEHIGQARPALDYYRRAVQLATVKGRANFNIAAAQERVARLEKVVP